MSNYHLVVGGSLKILQDLSSGLNVPYLQSLVSVALRIYTSVEGARTNRKQAKKLADSVGLTVNLIVQRFSATPLAPGLNEIVEKLQRILEDIEKYVANLSHQSRLRRLLNHGDDKESILNHWTELLGAQNQFILSIQVADFQARQLEEDPGYSVFERANIFPQEVVKVGTNTDVREEVAVLAPLGRSVILRHYPTDKFRNDIDNLKKLFHPNLPFLGASKITSPFPFMIIEPATHPPAHEVFHRFHSDSNQVLQRKAIEMITDVLEAINHLKANDIPLSELPNQMDFIQYDGHKVILNVETPPRCPPPPSGCQCHIHDSNSRIISQDFPNSSDDISSAEAREFLMFSLGCSDLKCYISEILGSRKFECFQAIENRVLQKLLGFKSSTSLPLIPPKRYEIPSAFLRPIWQYLANAGVGPEEWLSDMRPIRQQLRWSAGNVSDLRAQFLDTGRLSYLSFPRDRGDDPRSIELGAVAYLQSGCLVEVCNILAELQENGIASKDPYMLTDFQEEEGPLQESSVEEREFIGDHFRYEIMMDGYHLARLHLKSTVSLHDPEDASTCSRVQQYFNQRLPSLLKMHFPDGDYPSVGFILVTSVTSSRITEIQHTDGDALLTYPSQKCSRPCLICSRELRSSHFGTDRAFKFFFHASANPPETQDPWGVWTLACKGEDGEREMLVDDLCLVSHSYDPSFNFECAFAECF